MKHPSKYEEVNKLISCTSKRIKKSGNNNPIWDAELRVELFNDFYLLLEIKFFDLFLGYVFLG